MSFFRIIIIIFLYFAIYSCSNEQQKNKISPQDSIIEENNEKTPQNIFIKDSSGYSKKFICNIIEYNPDDLKFIDSLLIVGNDTVFIPVTLPLNKRIIFTGCDDNICYKLETERINYSTLKYKIEKNNKHIKCYSEIGFADLDHNFYYLDKDDEYEDEIKYSTITSDSCSFMIRIGKNADNILCAKIESSFCKNETKDIYNCPTLYQKK